MKKHRPRRNPDEYSNGQYHRVRLLNAREITEFVAAIEAARQNKRRESSTWEQYRRFMIHQLGERRDAEPSH